MDLFSYFGSFTAFAGGVVVITQFLNDLFNFKSEQKVAKKAVSWATAIIFAVIGFVCQYGFFADYGAINTWQGWVMTAVTGLGAGIYANGIYNIEPIKEAVHWIFKFIENWRKKDDTDKEETPEN